ncbi:hypothetical protein ACKW6Q_06715 [Chryseobacterium kwangjuense]|uniref:Uncharacterized protein n=1 Tax=Chryseobacterium kwangjuense TaxID=267125 RepID=A0ABW9K1Y6_9FLAO
MKFLLFKKRVHGTEIICENIPRYGVVVVVVVVETETAEMTGISDPGAEISDMFLRKFILDSDKCTNYLETAK